MSEQKEKNRKKKLYLELKELDDTVQKMNTQLEHIDEQLTEVKTTSNVLEEFSKLKEGDEITVPLTSGVYAKADLKSLSSVIINVGAGICVEKKPEEVLVILEGQIEELSDYRAKLLEEMKTIIARIEALQKEYGELEASG